MLCIRPAGFACGPHYCHLAELHYRKVSEGDSRDQTKKQKLEGETIFSRQGWIQSALAEGVLSVQPSRELAFRLPRACVLRHRSARWGCRALVLPFLLRRRLITAQSDSLLIPPWGASALFRELIKRTCCSSQIQKIVMLCYNVPLKSCGMLA